MKLFKNKIQKFQRFTFCTNNENKKFKVLFFGNDEISLPTLVKLREDSYKSNSIIEKIGIITTPMLNKKYFP